jgi:hypothetical protein
MIPTFRDIETGKSATHNRGPECSVYWWTEGNGSCDCNRVYAFGKKLVDEIEDTNEPNTCFGCKRFLCIDITGNLEGNNKQDLINMMNREYPEEARANLDS